MNKKTLFLITIILPLKLYGQPVELSLDDALTLGYQNNKELQVEGIQKENAERNAKSSWNSILPSLNLSLSESVALEGSASISLKSDYFTLINKSKTDYEIQCINYQLAFYEVHQNLSEVFFELMGLKNQIEVKRKAGQNLQEIYNENKAKYEKGFLSEIEYLSSKILFEKSVSELSQLEIEYNQKLNAFKQNLGLPSGSEISLKADSGKLVQEYESGFKNHKAEIMSLLEKCDFKEVLLLENQKISAEQNIKAKKLESWGPEISLSYTGGTNLLEVKNTNHFQFNNSLSARINLPLDNFLYKSKSMEEIRDCKDEVKILSLRLEDKKLNSQLELKNKIKQIEEQGDVLKTYSNFVEITARNFELCQNTYSKGLLDFQSLKNAQSEYLEAQTEYSEKEIELLKLYSTVEKITCRKIR